MVPLLEVVTHAVGGAVLQHPFKVLFFEVFFLGSDPELVDCKGLSPFDQAVDHESERAGPVLLGPNYLLFHADRVLLPLLERCRLVEEPHPLNHLAELLDATFLEQHLASDRIPESAHLFLSVRVNHLLVASP
jgi:hypothetical protein